MYSKGFYMLVNAINSAKFNYLFNCIRIKIVNRK